jgi:membrane protease YdiL (CAAX protease family)
VLAWVFLICGVFLWLAVWSHYEGGFWSFLGATLVGSAIIFIGFAVDEYMRGKFPFSAILPVAILSASGCYCLKRGHIQHRRKKATPPTVSSIPPSSFDEPTVAEKVVWRADDAWGCTVLLIILSYGYAWMPWIICRVSPTAAAWLASPFADIVSRVFLAGWWLLVVFLFARPRCVLPFMRSAGLSRPPTLPGWFAAWLGVVIGCFGLFGIIKGWIPHNQLPAAFYRHGGAVWWSYVLCRVFLTPFYEETVMRGFLYRAFRGSYNVWLSTFFVLCIVLYFHWGLVSIPLSFASIAIGAVLLCGIREWTGSLWDCILFHAAYNAIVTLRWPFCVFGMLAALPLCVRAVDSRRGMLACD